MNMQHRLRIVILGLIVWGSIASCLRIDAASQDWQYFEEVVFEVADELVASALREGATGAEISSYQASIDNLEGVLSDLRQKNQCPSPATYEAFRYLLDTLRRVASHPAVSAASPDFQRDVATLRQAVHASRQPSNSTPAQTSQTASSGGETPAPSGKFKIAPLNVATNEIIQEGATLRSGDKYKILFRAPSEQYIYIFQMDSSNKIFCLFPLDHFRGVPVNLQNPVRAGELYYVPAKEKSFALDQQVGKEQIFFLALPQPDPELERLYQRVQEVQNQGAPSDMRVAQAKFVKSLNALKGVASITEDAPSKHQASSQSGSGDEFSALRRYLLGSCQEEGQACLYTLTFMHK